MLVVTLHLVGYAFADMAVDGAPPTGNSNPVILFLFPLYYCFARIAVPFFFISSSYFLFKKIKQNPENRKEIIKKYCLRIFMLFLFWFIVQTPIMIDKYIIQSQYQIGEAILFLLFKILLLGGFDGAWYLVALIFSVLIANAMAKYSIKTNLIFAVILYTLCCLFSTYFNIFNFLPDVGILINIKEILKFLTANFAVYFTFCNGFIFVLIGRIFAEKENIFMHNSSTHVMVNYFYQCIFL